MNLQPPRKTRLFEAIRSSGLQQSQVAALTGLSESRLSRLCRGKAEPSPAELRQLAQAMSLPVERLTDPLAGLEPDEAAIEKLVAFLRGAEGKLFVGRLRAALE